MYKNVELSYILDNFGITNFYIDKIKEKNTKKNRVVYKVRSYDNFFCLKQMYLNKKYVLFIYSYLEWLKSFDFNVPILIKSKINMPFSIFNKNLFVLTKWIHGRKLNYANLNECINSIIVLSKMQSKSNKFPIINGADSQINLLNLNHRYSKSLNELHKLYIISRDIRDEFSQIFIHNYNKFHYLTYSSKYFSNSINFKNLTKSVCHGDFVNKNILINKNTITPIDFDKTCINFSIYDLAYFLRRYLRREFINWNYDLMLTLIKHYEKNNPLFLDDYLYLISYLSFPQKFFKISKFYLYNFQFLNANQKSICKNILLKLSSSLDDKLNFIYSFNNFIKFKFKN